MTQGYEATHSGKFLEGLVRREFAARGFHFRGFGEDQNNLDMFAPRMVVRNAPYASLYGCQSRSEFLIIDGSRKIRVECRWQESAGSVDEKYPIYCAMQSNACQSMKFLFFMAATVHVVKLSSGFSAKQRKSEPRKSTW